MYYFYLFIIILSFYIPLTYTQTPTVLVVRTEPEPKQGNIIYSQRDEDVTIWCYVENLPFETKVRFQKTYVRSNGRIQIVDIAEDERPRDNTKYAIEKPKDFTWRLRVKSAQPHDSGNYSCYVRISEYSSRFSNVSLIIYSKPVFLDHEMTTDADYQIGDRVTLRCSANGDPKPHVEWTRVGNGLLPIGKERYSKPILDILRVQPRDRGLYRCRSWNIMGEITRKINVRVLFPAIIEPVNSEVKQKEGYQTELQCLVETNPSPTKIFWERGDGVIFSQSNNRILVNSFQGAFNRYTVELILKRVEREDYGNYRCYVTNIMGTTYKTINLIKSSIPLPSAKQNRIIAVGSVIKPTWSVILCFLAMLFYYC